MLKQIKLKDSVGKTVKFTYNTYEAAIIVYEDNSFSFFQIYHDFEGNTLEENFSFEENIQIDFEDRIILSLKQEMLVKANLLTVEEIEETSKIKIAIQKGIKENLERAKMHELMEKYGIKNN